MLHYYFRTKKNLFNKVFEVKQFICNPFLPKMIIAYLLLIMLVMPLITTMEVKDIKVPIVDSDATTTSQDLVDKIGASNYFRLETVSESYQ